MRKIIERYTKKIQELEKIIGKRLLGLFIFNILLMMLILMRSAEYFTPFFLISINFIVFACIVFSVFLLGIRSKGVFLLALLFWSFAAFLRVLNAGVWAERTAIYAYQAIVVGVILFIMENSRLGKKDSNI